MIKRVGMPGAPAGHAQAAGMPGKRIGPRTGNPPGACASGWMYGRARKRGQRKGGTMTIRNLDPVLEPRSVAVFGATERPGAAATVVMTNLLAGGFEGPIWPVNPNRREVMGLPCHASAEALPETPDLAVIAAPPETTPGIIAALGAIGTKVAVLVGRWGGPWDALMPKVLEAARPSLLRVIGPGSFGVMVPARRLNASFSPATPEPGRLALVSQSGAIASSLTEWAVERGIGFSHVVSLGSMADVDLGDYLDLLAGDRATAGILLYLQSVKSPRKFMSAARSAARLKPVVAIKGGRYGAGALAAHLHTGTLVGSGVVADAALRRAGVLRVEGLRELFEAAEIMGRFRPLRRGRLAIATNAGAAGVLAVDRLMDVGGELAALSPETGAALDAVVPDGRGSSNPVDIEGDAGPERYLAALDALSADPGVDALLAMHSPTGFSEPLTVAEAVAGCLDRGTLRSKPVLSCWLGGAAARAGRGVLQKAGVASYESPAPAAAAVRHLTDWGRAQAALLLVPDRGEVDALGMPVGAQERVAAALAPAAAEGRRLLDGSESKEVVAAYGVPFVEVRVAASPEDVAREAAQLLARVEAVAVKLLSYDIPHKSEVGGVVLDRESPEAAAAAARAIAARVAERRPDARIHGFLVQPMLRRSGAIEVIAGIGRDEIFGPVIVFGAGGTAVEALRDTAVALPPLDLALAAELMGRTRVGAALAVRPEAQGDAIRRVLVALSYLTEDFPCIRGVDVNPLLVSGSGAVAVDALVEIEPGEVDRRGPNPDLVIRPYPAAWTREVELKGERYTFRAIRPTDAFLYPDFLKRLDSEAIRMRFLAPRRNFPEDMGLRLSQLDYDREMAFVAIAEDGSLAAVSRLSASPGREVAEYALVVRSDLAGRGLGTAILSHLIDYARAEGLHRLEGAVLRENRGMLGLITRLGFRVAPDPDDMELMATWLDLE